VELKVGLLYKDNNIWKSKAKEKSSELKKLKKKIKELTQSRDKWKKTAKKNKARNKNLEEKLKKNYEKYLQMQTEEL
jgi:hypothetical protein